MKINLFLIGLAAILMVFSAGIILAQSADSVKFPIAELGNCKDKADCKAYCDKPENITPCMSFAKQNGLMTEKEIKVAEEFALGEINGPGGCNTKDACEEYCNDMNHIDECIAFAEKEKAISAEELAEAKKVQAAIKQGIKPPPCGNKKACDAYCENPEHMEECIEFATKAGFMQGQELQDAQKMLQAIKRGVKPPPCKGKEECDVYCQNPDNMEVCMKFAKEAGFMTEEEAANSEKMLQAIKRGVKPPPCKGKEECDAYCQSEEHMEECINFSVAAGMMDAKDAEMAKKTRGKGPGGCMGKEECEKFCNEPANQKICFNFARDNGMIPQEELQKMEEGNKMFQQSLRNSPPEMVECFKQVLGQEIFEMLKNGTGPAPKGAGEKLQPCFEKFQPGPGQINPGDQTMPQQAGPGGCKGKEECQKYCEANPEECKKFEPAPNQPQGPGPGNMMPQVQPCSGENCQQGPLPENSILPLQPGQDILQGQPGAEGGLPKEQMLPLLEQAPPSSEPPLLPPAPEEQGPPPTSYHIINTDSLVGSLLYAAFISVFR